MAEPPRTDTNDHTINNPQSQGLRTTFPWVFWGFHEKYKIFI